ncbi:carboxymuconolactone decarboxylase family protein [Bradyrhizobium sp. AS23.2]|uniref:carboxymuconolactone decarboxylase family protein n=1 Tax=Bradyrhizobium sp. AS23.2 TaxID=1680155 RepID=UPI0024BF3D64|nr:carboxymuconolactone decarboxylase family protein [Bradyrhizobium sp. AS23.2]
MAVAVAHVTQSSPYCIKGHTKAALRQDATREELMEAIWIAAEMPAGGVYAHSTRALTTTDQAEDVPKGCVPAPDRAEPVRLTTPYPSGPRAATILLL